MSIQANINQITSLAALMLTQTPQYKAAAEKRTELGKIRQEERKIAKREEVAAEMGPVEAEQGVKFATEKAELAHKRYEIDPNKKNWEAYEAEAKNAQGLEAEAQRNKPTDVPDAYDEAGNVVRYKTQGELDEYMAWQETMANEAAANNVATTPAEMKRVEADKSLAAEQTNKRITRERTSFTSQRYGSWGRTDNKAFKGGSR